MPDVVGIRFKRCGRIYDFEVNGFDAKNGDLVVVESTFGVTIGTIVTEGRTIEGSEKTLKKVLRKATDEDLKAKEENNEFAQESRQFCLEKIQSRNLPMKLVQTEVTLDRKRIIFYFTADGRIDFRELVKDLASRFRTRIEMRQIGVRDETRVIGGIGICGREVCCKTFLSHFSPISIKMAKKQELALNTGKLSGLCGRLMCCLGYEVHSEEDILRESDDGEDTISLTEPVEEEIVIVEDQPEVVQGRKESSLTHGRESKAYRHQSARTAQAGRRNRPSGKNRDVSLTDDTQNKDRHEHISHQKDGGAEKRTERDQRQFKKKRPHGGKRQEKGDVTSSDSGSVRNVSTQVETSTTSETQESDRKKRKRSRFKRHKRKKKS